MKLMRNSSAFTTMLILPLSLMLGSCSDPEINPDNIITGVNYVGLSVANIEQSSSFYSSSTALETVEDTTLTDASVMTELGLPNETEIVARLMRSSNAQLRLMQFSSRTGEAAKTDPVPVYGPGIAHVCYQVAKETETYQKFLATGARTIGDPKMIKLNDSNPVEYAYARDLNGAIFEVEHVDLAALDLPEPPKHKHRIRHVSLATPDMDRLIDFYSAFLGGQQPRRVGRFWSLSGEKLDKMSGEKDSEIEMAWFQIRNLELELIQYHSHPKDKKVQPRPIDALGYNMIMFDVSELDEAKKRLENAGGSIVGKPVAMDGGQMQFGRDPDGNLLGLQKIPASAIFSSQNFANNEL